MLRRDIIVIGASAGGVQALLELVNALPADLGAAILVVVHTMPTRPNNLPEVLNFRSKLPAYGGQHGQTIESGHIYVAPSDLHMLVKGGKLELNHGPRENGTRPAIDPLFRSAARCYRNRVIGVILSGSLGDGAAGLMMIKSYGGIALVQSPDEASFSGMPDTAISYGGVDHILSVKEIASMLIKLTNQNLEKEGVNGEMEKEGAEGEVRPRITGLEAASPAEGAAVGEDDRPDIINRALWEQEHDLRDGKSAIYSCPDCSGVLWQIDENGITYFQCHVGHRLSPEVLFIRKSEELETALWSCVRSLQEKATLNYQIAAQMRNRGRMEVAAQIEEKAEVDKKTMRILREQILDIIPNSIEQSLAFFESQT